MGDSQSEPNRNPPARQPPPQPPPPPILTRKPTSVKFYDLRWAKLKCLHHASAHLSVRSPRAYACRFVRSNFGALQVNLMRLGLSHRIGLSGLLLICCQCCYCCRCCYLFARALFFAQRKAKLVSLDWLLCGSTVQGGERIKTSRKHA